jgi:hypothetical protein
MGNANVLALPAHKNIATAIKELAPVFQIISKSKAKMPAGVRTLSRSFAKSDWLLNAKNYDGLMTPATATTKTTKAKTRGAGG